MEDLPLLRDAEARPSDLRRTMVTTTELFPRSAYLECSSGRVESWANAERIQMQLRFLPGPKRKSQKVARYLGPPAKNFPRQNIAHADDRNSSFRHQISAVGEGEIAVRLFASI